MKILYFSPIYWGDLKQRPQHIAEELSKGNNTEVIFVEPSISIVSGLIKANDHYKQRVKKISSELVLFRPSGKYRLPRSFDLLDIFEFNYRFEKNQLKEMIAASDVIWLGSPVFYPLIKHIEGKKIVFDRMDDYCFLTKNIFMKKLLKMWEKQLLQKADLVIASSVTLYEDSNKINTNSHIIKNAVDNCMVKELSNNLIVQEINNLKNKNKVIFGYVGAIDHWFDMEAIHTILDYDENFIVCLVGKNNLLSTHKLSDRVKVYEAIPKSEIGGVINAFDYCLYPFLRGNPKIDTINPVKIYEYLSLNKPILAVKSREMESFDQRGLYLYDNIIGLQQILKSIDNVQNPFLNSYELSQFISNNNWNARTEKIIKLIKNN